MSKRAAIGAAETRTFDGATRALAGVILLLTGIVLLVIAGLPKRGEARGLLVVRLADRASFDRLAREGFDLGAVSLPPPRSPHVAGSQDGRRADRIEGQVEVLATESDAARLGRLGFQFTRVDRDHAEAQRARLATSAPKSAALAIGASLPPGFGQGSVGGYYSLAEMVALLDSYSAAYPQIVGPKISIGASAEGRPIYAIKISDHPAMTEPEPRILIDSLQHAREPTSMQTVLLLLHRLATEYGVDPAVTGLVDQREIWLVPCVNPDGYTWNAATNPGGGGLWRKNRRPAGGACLGVDLNRNFPEHFGLDDVGSSSDPCKESYRGPAALSEPESSALDAFAASLGPAVAVTLHAHGRQMMYPFGHDLLAPDDVAAYEAHGEAMTLANGYPFGAVADVVGLANGNYVDHMHANRHAEAWAFEIGTSFWPPIPEMIAAAESNLPALLSAVAFAGADLAPVALVVTDVSGDLDQQPDPGETIEPRVIVTNVGRAAVTSFTVDLVAVDPKLAIVSGHANGAGLASLGSATVGSGILRLALAPSVAPGARIALGIRIGFEGRTSETTLWIDAGTRRFLGRDDVEFDLGWSQGIASDTATTGRWTRADPIGILQGLEAATPENDVTPGTGRICFVTGATGTAPGQDDVDDGVTTLVSPIVDLSAATAPRLSLSRFYWCSKADSPLRFEASNDGGATWVVLEDVEGRPNSWRAAEWVLADFLTPTSRMRFRVVASDAANTSVVEALIDDVALTDFGNRPHVLVLGRPRTGGVVDLALAGPKNATVLLFAAAAPAQIAVPGLEGPLPLDPATLVVVASLGLGGMGSSNLPVTLPIDPVLVGAQVWLGLVSLGSPPTAGNATQVVIEAP